jgi:hypothetical protein
MVFSFFAFRPHFSARLGFEEGISGMSSLITARKRIVASNRSKRRASWE